MMYPMKKTLTLLTALVLAVSPTAQAGDIKPLASCPGCYD